MVQLLLTSAYWTTSECLKPGYYAACIPDVLVLEFCRFYNQCTEGFACFVFNIGQHLLMKISYRLCWKVKSNLKLEVWVTTSKIQTGLVSAKGNILVSP